MNREQRRHMAKTMQNITDASPEAAILMMRAMMDEQIQSNKKPKFVPGDRVKLNYSKIISDKDYVRLVPSRKKFIEENKDAIFTVEYDPRHTNNPQVVCLSEDANDPKWLWFVKQLSKVKDED